MKKLVFFLSACVCVSYVQAQTYTGYNYGNYYNSLAGATFNPANIANSQYKFDLNFFSISAFGNTNAYSVKAKNVLKLKFKGLKENADYTKINDGKNKNLWANIDILGPSFMMNLSKNGALAITTRARFLANEKNLSDSIFQLMTKGTPSSLFGKSYYQNDLKADIHGFAEVGLTYARTIWKTENHLLSGGITAKYLIGLASASFQADSVELNMRDETVMNALQGTASLRYSEGIDKLIGDNRSDVRWKDVMGNRGVGYDIGFSYEWRPLGDTKYFETREIEEGAHWLTTKRTSYRLKVALSVTDIGKIKYALTDNSKTYKLTALNMDQNMLTRRDGETVDELVDRLKNENSGDGFYSKVLTEVNTPSSYSVSLPTMLHANVDWQAYKHIFVNVNGNLNLVNKNKTGPRYANDITFSPRLEYRRLTLYSPVSFNNRTQWAWGAGVSMGLFYIGSGSAITSFLKSDIQSMDIHAGMHLPIRKKRAGKEDPMKKVRARFVDSDGDNIPDDRDKCPFVPGTAKYDGCPEYETPVEAAKKSEVVSYEEPKKRQTEVQIYREDITSKKAKRKDKDGDGITDEYDRCPKMRGTMANFGCPETGMLTYDNSNNNNKKNKNKNEKENEGGEAQTFADPVKIEREAEVPLKLAGGNKDTLPAVIAKPKHGSAVDTDGDGIIDEEDLCPNTPGVARYKGCPVPDTDGDGINDEKDKCPTVAGLIKNEGCPAPDTDGDGINDDKDDCPNTVGVARFKGCPVPDTDGDGINDEKDECPKVAGVARYGGCPVPDTDGDGVNDEKDKCPTIPGPVKYEGCPAPDTDGDGITDDKDECPKLAGTAANGGCPEHKKEIIKQEAKKEAATNTNYPVRKIQFVSGGDEILPASFSALQEVYQQMDATPDLKLSIEGYTDNIGSPATNRKLSLERANLVKEYFISKGISSERLTVTGYGEIAPIASNTTNAGRAKNRRVELKLN